MDGKYNNVIITLLIYRFFISMYNFHLKFYIIEDDGNYWPEKYLFPFSLDSSMPQLPEFQFFQPLVLTSSNQPTESDMNFIEDHQLLNLESSKISGFFTFNP